MVALWILNIVGHIEIIKNMSELVTQEVKNGQYTKLCQVFMDLH